MSDTDTSSAKKLVLIDGNSLLYRGFFAMRALTTSAGQPTNAVFSFTMMLLTLLSDQKPDVILCAWDAHGKTFRHEAYKEYKGTRQKTPTELVEQGPLARELVEAFNIPGVEAPGFEADDVIGTLARRGKEQGYEVLIVTGDLDALQLVEPGVRVLTTVKGVTDTVVYDEAAVLKRYGLRPDQLTDYRALKGDTSDNIPGVPGVGEKTASQLLKEYDTVENLLHHLDEIKQAKLQSSLVESTEQMGLSKRLATIIRDVPLEGVDLPALDAEPVTPDWAAVRALFERLEFRMLLRRLPAEGEEAPAPRPSRAAAAPTGAAEDLESDEYDPFADNGESAAPTPPARAEEPPADFRDADSPEAMAEMVADVKAAPRVGVRLHLSEGVPLDARLLGFALATGKGRVWYVPMEEATLAAASGVAAAPMASLFDEPAASAEPVAPAVAVAGPGTIPAALKPLLEDERVPKVTHEGKNDITVLRRYGVEPGGIVFDTELAAYLLNAGRRARFPLNEVAADYAGRELHPLDKKERKAMDEAAITGHERSETLAGADALLATMAVQEPRLSADGLTKVLETLELPVSPILSDMEAAGVPVDVAALNAMAADLKERVAKLEAQIFEIAGQEFTIGSPKQLQEILFEKMGLPSGKKTKTGLSTDADVLEELVPEYPIVGLILQHRELSKLKSTYAEAMPALVRKDTGRIHTTLHQTIAATGRLSSSTPNLQNIPIRTEIGREIRRAFVAPKGRVLVAADYSQIELRLFAHVTEDPALMAAFGSGEDIHKYTAGQMYGIPVADVTGEQRRAAKTVNYAVIYGISDFALARLLSVPQAQAKELKANYFARFPGVKSYSEQTLEFARAKGYVQTLFGRRRFIPDINSRVFQFRQAAERAAINMPIQGTSADVMKLAMVAVDAMLGREKFGTRMLLQVHDELLFEAPPEEVPHLAQCLRETMRMDDVHKLKVPLEIEVKTGHTWADVTPIETDPVPIAPPGG